MTTTGLFPYRQSQAGPRPAQRYAHEATLDARVAEALADGLTKQQAARAIGTTVTQVDASFRRICMGLGDQAR